MFTLKFKKLLAGIGISATVLTATATLASCGHHSTLSIINDNGKYLFDNQGLFIYKGGDATKSVNWTTKKTLSSGNYIIAIANSGADNTWKMLFDDTKNSTMPTKAYQYSITNPNNNISGLFGGTLIHFLDSTNGGNDLKYTGDWLKDNHIGVAIVEYKAPKNHVNADSSNSDKAKNYIKVVKALGGLETGSLTFLKGSSKVSADSDKHIDPTKAQFNFSNPSANTYNGIYTQLKNIYGTPNRRS